MSKQSCVDTSASSFYSVTLIMAVVFAMACWPIWVHFEHIWRLCFACWYFRRSAVMCTLTMRWHHAVSTQSVGVAFYRQVFISNRCGIDCQWLLSFKNYVSYQLRVVACMCMFVCVSVSTLLIFEHSDHVLIAVACALFTHSGSPARVLYIKYLSLCCT